MLEIALLIATLSASAVKYDSPGIPDGSPDRLPRTIWRSDDLGADLPFCHAVTEELRIG
jgi:hypothetical protein